MDIPNAFIGKTSRPTNEELTAALGPAASPWTELLDTLEIDLGITEHEWQSLKPRYGWTLILKLKKRRIIYLGPCAGCFRASLILGDRAMTAARATKLSKPLLKLLDEAPHYPEGTGIRFLVKTAKDLPAIRKLVKIKLQN